jgi:hypothetical protein
LPGGRRRGYRRVVQCTENRSAICGLRKIAQIAGTAIDCRLLEELLGKRQKAKSVRVAKG